MSFPRYPTYIYSGVEWLGEVPEHWQIKRFKRIFREREERSVLGEEMLLSVSSYTGVSPRSEVIDVGDHLSRAETLEGYKMCFKDDLVMNIMLAWNRGLAFTEYDGIVSPAYCVFVVIDGSDPKFLNYLVRSDEYTLYFKAFSAGVIDSRLRIYPDTFGRLHCSVPPFSEQTQIATFLDRETAKIDELVAEQRRLMDLLKEKRQAVISHTVTQGLNSHVPMKPSGLEWLGDVPKHWEVTKLSRLTTKIGDGLHGTPEYVDDSAFYFINGNNLANGSISIADTTRCISEVEWDKHRVELNQTTVLLSINGTIGNFALYRGESVMLGKSAAYINCNENILREYLCWFMQSTGVRRYFDFSVTGTTIYNLSLDSIRKMPVALPPSDEQFAIGTFLVERAGEYDGLLGEAQRAIDLLQERRTALISAAVTGQNDVLQLAQEQAA